MNQSTATSGTLKRDVGLFGATLLGLGSILGTGIFVALAFASQIAGVYVLPAIGVAALVAFCNGMSSAQLAARHPVSGGTYEYGYRWLSPTLGFAAGWMFLAAKSASAATAALGAAGYLLQWTPYSDSRLSVVVAIVLTLLLTLLVLSGLRRSNRVNTAIVSATVLSLVIFSVALLGVSPDNADALSRTAVDPLEWRSFLEACALMFVAYTGYGRVATLGEELHNPERNIPKAIFITLLVSMLLYLLTGWAITAHLPSLANSGSPAFAAPLEELARSAGLPGIAGLVSLGAITAMLGVLLNLILGLSRVWLAMGRRGDMPAALANIDRAGQSPYAAVIVTGCVIVGLCSLGDVKTTWSFSAFTVLVYYAITNLSALQLTPEERLYPRALSVLGLCSCLGLAFWVEPTAWLAGLTVLAAGLIWRFGFRLLSRK
ncbi:APC family permease [Rubinisphaera brasiliensis]|uniref:Amino acid/polyamine/organocation transporter, APC superfamily n=1 Tax=Rubinisphaera brasiliensis (strain ATCC 49424 / DSM 5305 / JCM 21570 / IAM 15109 / NBRC 103401 / IFAM 1448) TaxID=756272 RepID=F0SSS9_RUBBR|nr:APC family permease [Rubinisphaera brasiliensis]ADY61407.1 amino acid/polyamine/organocation transporter, APC superfamily [Rubinisphaera brasiliensis DSM 5305]